MWSVLGQYQPKATQPAAGGAPPAEEQSSEQVVSKPDAAAEEALTRREAELSEKAAALEKAEADAAVKAEAATAAEQAASLREAALNEREASLATREASIREQEVQLATSRERLAEREAEVQRMTGALTAREQALDAAEAAASSRQQCTAPVTSDTKGGAEGAGAPSNAVGPGAAPGRFPASSRIVDDKPELPAGKHGVESEASNGKLGRVGEPKKADVADNSLRSKVRFNEQSKLAAGNAGTAREAKPAAAKADGEARDIQCDCTADWARSENLTASLVRQRTENPDEVFFPLPHQRTCELADIFSAPRRRERGKGSGEWTPMSEDVTRNLFQPTAPPKEALPSSQVPLQLLGIDGEYMGEQLALPAVSGTSGPAKIILIGRSSSCDITLSRDDQISRRHMQIEARDGKLLARDLGSTCAVQHAKTRPCVWSHSLTAPWHRFCLRRYGTRINGKALGAEAAELKPGDVLVLGASSFQLQSLGK